MLQGMAKETRGRPSTGKNPTALLVTLPADLLKRIDAWRAGQFDEDLNRQAAIRQLLEFALARKGK
jgi:hypothetical protein